MGCWGRPCSLVLHPAEVALGTGRLGRAEVRQESLVGMRWRLQHPRVVRVGAKKRHVPGAEGMQAALLQLCSGWVLLG